MVGNQHHSIMTKEEEIPDWVGAQEFYDKYEPKEILGRYVLEEILQQEPLTWGHKLNMMMMNK